MSPIETQETLSEDITGASENDNLKLVPVAESIRYRKRAQSAEKKLEALTEQLAEAKSQTTKMSEQLSNIQNEQELMRKLVVAGAIDLETAVIIAKARIKDQDEADLDGVVEQLKKDKQYLFAGTSGTVTIKKTAGAAMRSSVNGYD